jgi:hypothetical protein
MDLQTVSKVVSSDTAGITLGGQVAPGMKRWVSFLAVDTAAVNAASEVVVYLASVATNVPTKASIVATGNRKKIVPLEGTQLSRSSKRRPVMFPAAGPDPENPIFCIAEGAYLGVYASKTTANVSLQFFDE